MSRGRAGFSLVELVIAIVVVAIAAAAIGSAFAYMSHAQTLATDLQRATQIAQECADHVIGRGRKPGTYATIPVGLSSTFCDGLPASAGFARTVNIRSEALPVGNTIPAGTALCDTASWNCKHVEISVRRGAAVITLNFMLINY